MNLLSNAINHTDHGMIMVSASLVTENKTCLAVQFEVKDSGEGISDRQMNYISDAFMHADFGITREGGGTGLGLVITRSLVELMGGDLNIESAPGIGTRSSFTLKLGTTHYLANDAYNRVTRSSGGGIIDFEAGIENSAGSEEMHKEFLNDYFRNQRNTFVRINKAVRKKNFTTAYEIAHKEMGAVAIIGASRLSAVLKGLQEALVSRENESINESMNLYSVELDSVLDSIKTFTSGGSK